MRPMSSTLLLNLDVPDLARGERFYTRAFGLTCGRRLGEGFLELCGWPVEVYLLVKAPGTDVLPSSPSPRRDYTRHWTPVHFDVVVDDLDGALARAVAEGAVLETPVRDEPYGRLALLGDPFGHGFCLIEFNARGYDAIAT